MEIKLRIHTWPEKILRTKCKDVKEVDDNIRNFLDQMYRLMRVADGIGLAANQAGLDLNLIVVQHQDQVYKLINPKIIKRKGKITFLEGCLSFPALEIEVKRANKVRVAALNEKREAVDIEAEGILAVVLQHEIDHISGIVFIDRIPFWKRIKIKSQLKKIKKQTHDKVQKIKTDE
ncbi:MAG: peptide deformylase [Candidatus Omnitrophota bacterium]|nr:MAG: peptide deformylase [Candidatus Omnitrophota bacterium]